MIPKNAPDQYHRNTEITENDFTPTLSFIEKRVCSPRARTGVLYTSCEPAGTKPSRLSPLEDFAPSSCGQPPVSACAQADPVRCPRPGKRCRRKQGVIPSWAYGRRRYNTLDLASKIVCHGNSLFPLDPLRFPSPARTNVLHLRCLRKCKKGPDFHP